MLEAVLLTSGFKRGLDKFHGDGYLWQFSHDGWAESPCPVAIYIGMQGDNWQGWGDLLPIMLSLWVSQEHLLVCMGTRCFNWIQQGCSCILKGQELGYPPTLRFSAPFLLSYQGLEISSVDALR